MRPEQIPPPIPQKKGPPPIPGKEGPPPIPKSKAEKLGNLIDAETQRFDEEPIEIDVSDLSEPKDISHEVARLAATKMSEWQKEPNGVAGTLEVSKGMSVSFDSRFNGDKRAGENEPGGDAFVVAKSSEGNPIVAALDGAGGEGVKGTNADAEASAAFVQELPAADARARIEVTGSEEEYKASYLKGLLEWEPRNKDVFAKEFNERFESYENPVKREVLVMRETLLNIHREIQGLEKKGVTTAVMGSTVVLEDGRQFEVIANVGDGGALKIEADGSVSELTTEHSYINGLVKYGLVSAEDAKNPDFMVKLPGGEEKTVQSLRSAVTRFIGMKDKVGVPEPDISVTEFKPGESIIYLTDGIRDLEIFQNEETKIFDPSLMEQFIKDNDGVENLATAINETADQHEAELKKAGKYAKKDEKTVLMKSRALLSEDVLKELESKPKSSSTPPPIPQAEKGKKKGFFSRILGKK